MTILILLLFQDCIVEKHKIYYLNSYHTGYGSSDKIQDAIFQVLDLKKVTLASFELDAKRLNSEQLNDRAQEAWKSIRDFKPDILLISDDNAMESVVVPHLFEIDYPVLFCGVNWSAEKYNLPANKTSGMLEILPVEQCITSIRDSGYEAKSITIISENSTAEQKNKTALMPVFNQMGLDVSYHMVNDFESWKQAFLNAQVVGNLVFIPTNGAIKQWKHEEAVNFVADNIKVPVFTCDDFMVPYACFGLTKVAEEQGNWLATMALEVLQGKSIVDIPISKNRMVLCLENRQISERINFKLNSTVYKCK